MSKVKPSIPKGTRDFNPQQVQKRNYIFDTIEQVFELYGFQPIETPTMENLSTLTGNYGEEGDQLLFKVLNSGDFLKNTDTDLLAEKDSKKITGQISEKGLRYDLTIPFARYVVMHQNEITFPFKRYQIQPVWRADRPQRGRYREFYQCDADVVGSNSLVYEAELVQIYQSVFDKLRLPVTIKLNNRKILEGIVETAGTAENFIPVTVAIDKLDKIGADGVKKELMERGVTLEQSDFILNMINKKGKADEVLSELAQVINTSETGLKGLDEMRELYTYLRVAHASDKLPEIDLTLARGLSYYTGTIVEVKARNLEFGSIGGGGRYDNLTGVFGLPNVSGVGISFGADRIYDVLEELQLFPEMTGVSTQILFTSFDEKGLLKGLEYVQHLRQNGITAEIYPTPGNLKKQLKYANDKGILYVGILGDEELNQEKVMLKDMQKGEQELLSVNEIIEKISG